MRDTEGSNPVVYPWNIGLGIVSHIGKLLFNGGDLSSDAGLLLIKEFAAKIGFTQLVKRIFKTTDSASMRYHTDADNLMQMVYQIIASYFEDDCADELRKDPVFRAILDKSSLASQPTISRFHNRMDENTLKQFDLIEAQMRDIIYSVKKPEHMLFDLDSTLLATYGKQEGEGFNFHYQAHGYHPIVLLRRTDRRSSESRAPRWNPVLQQRC